MRLTRNLGRTTFVNTLCGKKVLLGQEVEDPATAHIEEGVRIKPITVGTQARRTRIRSKELH